MLKKVKLVRLYRLAGQEKPNLDKIAEEIHDYKLVSEAWIERTNSNWLNNGGKYYIEEPKKTVSKTTKKEE